MHHRNFNNVNVRVNKWRLLGFFSHQYSKIRKEYLDIGATGEFVCGPHFSHHLKEQRHWVWQIYKDCGPQALKYISAAIQGSMYAQASNSWRGHGGKSDVFEFPEQIRGNSVLVEPTVTIQKLKTQKSPVSQVKEWSIFKRLILLRLQKCKQYH